MTVFAQVLLEELLISGFAALAWIRATGVKLSAPQLHAVALLRLPGRLQRIKRSQWQWFSAVAIMLVLRLQGQLALPVEVVGSLQFALFMAWPSERKV